MNAYSEDLRKKIVEAAERGTPKTEVAHAFGVGVSSVKRYVATRRHLPRGPVPGSQEAPRFEAEARRGGEEAPRSGPRRAPRGDPSRETRVLREGGRGAGE